MSEGAFVWYELTSPDPQASADFYAHVIGWRMEAAEMPGMTYRIAHAGDRQVAGIMGFPPGMPAMPTSHWWGYIGVDDVDAKAEALRAAGGQVMRAPGDIPGVGRFAVVTDPQGSAFMLFRSAGEESPPPPYMTPGTAGWHELAAKDWEAVFPFYAGLFGWQKADALDMGPMGTYQLLTIAGAGTGAMMSAQGPQPTGWLYYFAVDDIDAAKARLEESGGTVAMGPHEVPGGAWIIVGVDPQGGTFAIVGPPKA